MNIIDQSNHLIYLSNLKLSEIRCDIENQIRKLQDTLFDMDEHGVEPDEYVAISQMKGELEEYLEKLG